MSAKWLRPTGTEKEYGRRLYLSGKKKKSYVDLMQEDTDKAELDKQEFHLSEFKKPYLADSYEEMEHYHSVPQVSFGDDGGSTTKKKEKEEEEGYEGFWGCVYNAGKVLIGYCYFDTNAGDFIKDSFLTTKEFAKKYRTQDKVDVAYDTVIGSEVITDSGEDETSSWWTQDEWLEKDSVVWMPARSSSYQRKFTSAPPGGETATSLSYSGYTPRISPPSYFYMNNGDLLSLIGPPWYSAVAETYGDPSRSYNFCLDDFPAVKGYVTVGASRSEVHTIIFLEPVAGCQYYDVTMTSQSTKITTFTLDVNGTTVTLGVATGVCSWTQNTYKAYGDIEDTVTSSYSWTHSGSCGLTEVPQQWAKEGSLAVPYTRGGVIASNGSQSWGSAVMGVILDGSKYELSADVFWEDLVTLSPSWPFTPRTTTMGLSQIGTNKYASFIFEKAKRRRS